MTVVLVILWFIALSIFEVAANEPPPEGQYRDNFVVETYVETPPVKEIPLSVRCSCVLLAKQLTGYSEPIGLAKNWPINSRIPVVGGVVVTNENARYGHVVVITAIDGDTMTVVESNFVPCRVTTRQIKMSSPQVRGFWVK